MLRESNRPSTESLRCDYEKATVKHIENVTAQDVSVETTMPLEDIQASVITVVRRSSATSCRSSLRHEIHTDVSEDSSSKEEFHRELIEPRA